MRRCGYHLLLTVLLLVTLTRGQDAPVEVPAPVRELLGAKDFRERAFAKVANRVRLQFGSLAPIEAAARAEKTPLAHRVLVEVYLTEGKLTAAWQAGLAWQKSVPTAPDAAYFCGRLAEMVGRHEAAVTWYQRALELKPKLWLQWQIRTCLSLLFHTMGKAEQAREQLRQIAALKQVHLAASAARIAGLHGDKKFAAQYAAPIQSKDRRRLFLSLMQTAFLKHKGDDFSGATGTLAKARKLARSRRERRFVAWAEAELNAQAGTLPGMLAAWLAEQSVSHERLGVAVESLARLGKLDQALALLQRPEANEPLAAEWTSLLLTLALEGGQEEKALGILRARLTAKPTYLEYRLHLSRVLVDLGRVAPAKELWVQALKMPELCRDRRLITLCGLIADAGFPGLARQELNTCYSKGTIPRGMWAGLELAQLWEKSGAAEKARQILQAITVREQLPVDVMRAAGESLERLGYQKEAAAVYARILTRVPGEDLEIRLAWLQARIGNGMGAIPRLRRIWRETTSPSRRRQVEDRLLELSAKEGVLGDLVEELEEAIEQGQARVREITLLVNIYSKVGDPESAADVLDSFAAKGGDQVLSLQTLSRVYMDAGELRKYEAVMRKLLAIDPANAKEWWMQLAMSALERSAPDDARRALKQLAARGDSSHAFKAGVLAFAGLHQESIKEYRLALAEEPDQVETWLLLGGEMAVAGRKKEAINLYKQIVNRSGAADLFVVALDGLLNLNAPREVLTWAIRRVEEKIAIYPTKIYLYRLLGDLLETVGQPDRSHQALVELVPVAAEQRGVILRELLDASRAKRDVKGTVKYGRQLMALGEIFPPDVYLAVGEALLKEKAFSEAARVFSRAQEATDFVALQKRVAAIYGENGQVELALRILRRLRLQSPEDPGLQIDLAAAESAVGKPAALASWERAMEMVLARTPRQKDIATKVKRGYFSTLNQSGAKLLWERVLVGLCSGRKGPAMDRLLTQLVERTHREIAAVKGQIDPDRMPRLALLLNAVFRISLTAGNATVPQQLARTLLKEKAGTGGGRVWVSGRLPELFRAGWGCTAKVLLAALGKNADPLLLWQARWLAAGKPPVEVAPTLRAALARVTWAYVFSGQGAAKKELDRVLARFPASEKRLAAIELLPFHLAWNDRAALRDGLIEVIRNVPDKQKGKRIAYVSVSRLRAALSFSWRYLAAEDRDLVLAELRRLALAPTKGSEWRSLYLHGLLAAGPSAWENLDLTALVRDIAKDERRGQDRGALFVLLVAPEARVALVDSMVKGKPSYAKGQFLLSLPQVLGAEFDTPLLDCICRHLRAGKPDELKSVSNFLAHNPVNRLGAVPLKVVLRIFDTIAENLPDDPGLRLGRIRTLVNAGKLKAARDIARPLLKSKPAAGTNSYYHRESLRLTFGTVSGGGGGADLNTLAAKGNAPAAIAHGDTLAAAGRIREAYDFLDKWLAKHGTNAQVFEKRIRLLARLGDHLGSLRETREYLRENSSLRSHWHLNLASRLHGMGRFRAELAAIANYRGHPSSNLDYSARQRLSYYCKLPPSPGRDQAILQDVRKFLRPRGRAGHASLGFQFRNIPPTCLTVLRDSAPPGTNLPGLEKAAEIPAVRQELEAVLQRFAGERDVTQLFELVNAVVWGYQAAGEGAQLRAATKARFAVEPSDVYGLVLANTLAAWDPEARSLELVKRGFGQTMITSNSLARGYFNSWESRETAFWVDRLALTGDVEGARRLAHLVLCQSLINSLYWNNWDQGIFANAQQLTKKLKMPEKELWVALAARLPNLPMGVFVQAVNSWHMKMLDLFVKADQGEVILAQAPHLVAWLERNDDPGIAGAQLCLAAAFRSAGKAGKAEYFLRRCLAGAARKNLWLDLDILQRALPGKGPEARALLDIVVENRAKLGVRRTVQVLQLCALKVAKEGDKALGEKLWQAALEACGKEDVARREALGMAAVKAGQATWAKALLLPLFQTNRLAPENCAQVYTQLRAAGVPPAELQAGLTKMVAIYPRKDLALLALENLAPSVAKKALQAALAETPRDQDLKEALAGV